MYYLVSICENGDRPLYSLKNHGADEAVNGMFEMGAETMALPLEEKMKFEQGDNGTSHGCATRPSPFSSDSLI